MSIYTWTFIGQMACLAIFASLWALDAYLRSKGVK